MAESVKITLYQRYIRYVLRTSVYEGVGEGGADVVRGEGTHGIHYAPGELAQSSRPQVLSNPPELLSAVHEIHSAREGGREREAGVTDRSQSRLSK